MNGEYLLTKYGRAVMTVEQSADELGVSEEAIWGLIRQGSLRAVSAGEDSRIPVFELAKYIEFGGTNSQEQRTVSDTVANNQNESYHVANCLYLDGLEDLEDDDMAVVGTSTGKIRGSVFYNEQRKEWRAQFPIVIEGVKKRKLLTGFKTQKEAERQMLLAQICARGEIDILGYEAARNPVTVAPATDRHLLSDLLDKHIELKKSDWKESTYLKNQYYVNKLKTLFNGEYLEDINRTRVEEFRVQMSKSPDGKPYNKDHVRGVANILKSVLERAVDDDLIQKTPYTKGVKAPDGVSSNPKKRRLTAEQVVQLKHAVKNNSHYRTVVDVLLGTGMRIGELLALDWDDVDFENKRIYVRQAMTKMLVGKGGSCYEQDDTKTACSVRTIPIFPEVAETLELWREYVLNNSKLHARIKEKGTEGFVMVNTRGNSYNYQALQDKFKDYIRNRGIEFPITLHYLRHTYATNLLDDGVPADVIQKLLGHAELSMTMDSYADTTDSRVDGCIELISDSFRARLKPLK